MCSIFPYFTTLELRDVLLQLQKNILNNQTESAIRNAMYFVMFECVLLGLFCFLFFVEICVVVESFVKNTSFVHLAVGKVRLSQSAC